MKSSIAHGTHLPIIMKLVSITDGPILEIGGGQYSTPFLHWACFFNKRELVTYENSPEYFNTIRRYNDNYHKVILLDNWNQMPVERYWDIVFIDHAPGARRKVEIARLANLAKYIVVHDTEEREEHLYGLKEIYPLFKFKYDFMDVKPHTSVLSNFINLNDIQWTQR